MFLKRLMKRQKRCAKEGREMAKWKKLEEMTYLGKSYTRVDGPDIVTGRAKYTYDIKLPGMLYACILRSPHPHAKIKKIDWRKVEALPGVKAVLTDIKEELFFVGDDVAAVAAVSEEIANDALQLFEIEYDVLPFTVIEEEAMQQNAPRVFSGRTDNFGEEREREEEGDVSAGFRQADVVLERTYRMAVQIHCTLETHGCVAKWEGDELYLWDSTQGVHGTRSGIARHFEIPENKVHVITHYMGGGFGSKFGPKSYNIICVKLAQKANAPVKLMLDREEELLSTGNRPSSIQKIKVGAKRDGTLTAFQIDSYGTAGIGDGAGVPQPYIYHFPNIKIVHNDIHINAGAAEPMRAPGHPQANFAMESIMDELAEKLNMDPLKLRMINDPNKTRRKEYQLGAEKIGWQRRKKSGSGTGIKRRGIGMGSGRWGGGGDEDTKAMVSIYPDGSVEVKIGTQDLGVGTRTIVAGIVAEELGLEIKDVRPLIGESDYPWAPASGGSVTAASISPAIKHATEKAKEQLIRKVSGYLNVSQSNLVLKNKVFTVKDDPKIQLTWKEACSLLEGQPISELESWAEGLSDRGTTGCQFAEVEVDTETGEITVLKMVAVQDCGLVLNMLTANSQVNGGIIGEIGYVLLENRVIDRESGMVLNANMENYKIPGALEMPEFDVTMFDESHRGVIGLGEPPVIPGNGAIANAIANAIGVRIYETPITPDKVLAALAKDKEGRV
jgi:xanthine dehydrogenase YagR molybdenum-binding subunit